MRDSSSQRAGPRREYRFDTRSLELYTVRFKSIDPIRTPLEQVQRLVDRSTNGFSEHSPYRTQSPDTSLHPLSNTKRRILDRYCGWTLSRLSRYRRCEPQSRHPLSSQNSTRPFSDTLCRRRRRERLQVLEAVQACGRASAAQGSSQRARALSAVGSWLSALAGVSQTTVYRI